MMDKNISDLPPLDVYEDEMVVAIPPRLPQPQQPADQTKPIPIQPKASKSAPEFPRVTLAQAAERPKLDFVLPGLLSGSIGLIVGQGAIGKSYLSLALAYAVATGGAAPGLGKVEQAGEVLLLMGEDPPEILQERLFWLRGQIGITPEMAELADARMHILSGRGFDLRILTKVQGGALDHGPFFRPLIEMAREKRLVILDPLAFLSDADENDNASMTRLMAALYQVARVAGTTILILHHVGKGGKGDREAWAMARGAGAITSAARWQASMTPIPSDEIEMLGITPEDRAWWVKLSIDKINYGEAPAGCYLRRGKGGVLMQEEPPAICAPAVRECERDARKSGVPMPQVDPKIEEAADEFF